MLFMTSGEVRIRRGSLLIWRRYQLGAGDKLTCEEVPVRLLAVVGSNRDREHKTLNTEPRRLRVQDPATAQIHDVEMHYLIDPTRAAAPSVIPEKPPSPGVVSDAERYRRARERLRSMGRRR